MDIDRFIARHRPEWERLEKMVAGGTRDLASLPGPAIDDLLQLYQRVSAHLSEVRATYRDRSLERYLTSVLASAHAAVYGARPKTTAGLLRTFGTRYRQAIRRTAPFIAVAALALVVSIAGSLAWLVNSPEARAGVIPPEAQRAIERFDGRASFDDQPSGLVSGFILFNNVRVSFLAFAAGIALGGLTLLLVLYNGWTVGSLAAGFHVAGKGAAFWALIVPHGVLELTAIAIAAGCGMRIGWSLIEPGDRPRSRALAEESADAVTAVVGAVPAFVVAALVEGFVTGQGHIPRVVQLALGVGLGVAYLVFLFGLPSRRPARAVLAA